MLLLVFKGVSKSPRKSFIFDNQTDGFSIALDNFQALSLELGSSCYVLTMPSTLHAAMFADDYVQSVDWLKIRPFQLVADMIYNLYPP